MRNIVALCAAALALASPGVAQAQGATFSPAPGSYVFTGSVEVKKNLPVWTTCDLTLTINVAAGGTATSTASLAGAFPCTGITFTGGPFLTDGLSPPTISLVEIADVTINIPPVPPFAADSCFGTLYAVWGGNGPPNPRTIEFQDPLSDTPDAGSPGSQPNCKIKGTVSQASGATQLNIN
ncbi:MAG: hypothetical protein J7499_08930 [Sphingopyxis sp.]|nr:hypothetical protein [Sphingopyxis sp.]